MINFNYFEAWGVDEATYSSWESYEVDLSKEYPPVDFLLEHKGVGILPRGELIAVAGKAKSGKSYMLSLLTAALLGCEDILSSFTALCPGVKILLCDTEMHSSNVAERARKTLRAAGLNALQSHPNYKILSLRELSHEERFNAIEEAIKSIKPDIVIIDGVVDLLADFNSVEESKTCVGRLMRLSSQNKCAIVSVLHENKSAIDNNMRGHLGTELTNKCSEVYSVKHDTKAGHYTVEQTMCRNRPAGNWAFVIDEGGMPEIIALETPESKASKKDREELNTFADIFSDSDSMTHTELVAEYMERAGVAKPTAARHVSGWVKRGELQKANGLYTMPSASIFG